MKRGKRYPVMEMLILLVCLLLPVLPCPVPDAGGTMPSADSTVKVVISPLFEEFTADRELALPRTGIGAYGGGMTHLPFPEGYPVPDSVYGSVFFPEIPMDPTDGMSLSVPWSAMKQQGGDSLIPERAREWIVEVRDLSTEPLGVPEPDAPVHGLGRWSMTPPDAGVTRIPVFVPSPTADARRRPFLPDVVSIGADINYFTIAGDVAAGNLRGLRSSLNGPSGGSSWLDPQTGFIYFDWKFGGQ